MYTFFSRTLYIFYPLIGNISYENDPVLHHGLCTLLYTN